MLDTYLRVPDTYHIKLGMCEKELRNRLNNNRILVDLEGSKIRVAIYEFTDRYEYKRFVYYANWKEAYNPKNWCDHVVLMHTFGVTEQ